MKIEYSMKYHITPCPINKEGNSKLVSVINIIMALHHRKLTNGNKLIINQNFDMRTRLLKLKFRILKDQEYTSNTTSSNINSKVLRMIAETDTGHDNDA